MNTFRWVNILSLDVTAGAVICSAFLSVIWSVPIRPLDLFLLADAVWLIYTFDHLKDAYDIRNRSSTYRHRFHYRHFKPLLWLCIFCIIVGMVGLLWVDERILRLGIILLGLVGTYFLALHFLPTQARYHKELVIALLYALGVGLSPLSVSKGIDSIHMVHVIQLFLIALGNLFLFSWFEQEKDEQSGFPSMLQSFFREHSEVKIRFFLLTQAAGCMLLYAFSGYALFQLTILLMIIILFLMTFFHDPLKQEERYRFLGDGIFLLPLISICVKAIL